MFHQICRPCFIFFFLFAWPSTGNINEKYHKSNVIKQLELICLYIVTIVLQLVTIFPKCQKWLVKLLCIYLPLLCLIFIVIFCETQFSIRDKHIKIQYQKSKKEWVRGSLPHPSVSYLRLHFPRSLHLFTFQSWEMFMGLKWRMK